MEDVGDYTVANITPAMMLDRPSNPTDKSHRNISDGLYNKKIPNTVEDFMELEGLVNYS